MIAVAEHVQRETEVTHHITDLSAYHANIGQRGDASPLTQDRRDEFKAPTRPCRAAPAK